MVYMLTIAFGIFYTNANTIPYKYKYCTLPQIYQQASAYCMLTIRRFVNGSPIYVSSWFAALEYSFAIYFREPVYPACALRTKDTTSKSAFFMKKIKETGGEKKTRTPSGLSPWLIGRPFSGSVRESCYSGASLISGQPFYSRDNGCAKIRSAKSAPRFIPPRLFSPRKRTFTRLLPPPLDFSRDESQEETTPS